jgi:archaeosine synthase
VTGHWSEEEKEFVCECLESYLRSQKYDRIIAHVDGAYKEIIEIVADELNIEILYTSTGKTTSDGSLRKLRETVRGIAKPNDGRFPEGKSDSPLVNRHYTGRFPERKSVMIKAIADYQFGVGAGEMLIGKSRILGSFPRYEVRDREKLATLVPEYGLLALTIAGAKKMMDFDSYYVRIDDFVPKGSILAPGVTDADHRIRTNDEVIIIGEGAFGVGRAVMNGWEMSESSRGVAVDVRYIEER